jgi:hypothetical protein
MNSTLFSLLMAGMLAQPAPHTQTPAVPAEPTSGQASLKVRIGTSTYLADGRVLTTASDWGLALSKSVTAYAAAGKSMCEPHAATLVRPVTTPASGWQVELTPVSESAGQLDVRVEWRQLGPAPKPAGQPTLGTAMLKLHAGDRVVVDYDRSAESDTCNAVGVSLEIGLEASKTDAVVEAELWLVRANRDGSEKSERQLIRLPIGQPPTSYYFDEARLGFADIPSAAFLAKVSGELAAFAVDNGKIHFHFKVARLYDKLQLPNADATSAYRDLVATSGEVLAFQLPPMEVPTFSTRVGAGQAEAAGFSQRTLPVLSIRVRLRILK